MALGATAVSVGRALLRPLHSSGAQGVETTINNMTAELVHAMARTCTLNVYNIDLTVIWNKQIKGDSND